MADTPLVYLACFTMNLDYQATYRRWYESKHVPDVMRLGFWTARAYTAGEPTRIWDMYEITDADLFSGPDYAAMQAGDPMIAEAFANIIDRSATIYDQVVASAGPAIPPIPSGDLVAARIGLDGADDSERLATVIGELAEAEAIGNVRLCRHHAVQHPQAPAYEPEWLVLAASAPGAGADAAEAAVRAALTETAEVDIVSLRQWYGLSREDVW